MNNEKERPMLWEEGINHLTTDNMIYDCLRKAQLNDELLQKFVIKYIDNSLATKPNTAQKNSIYIARDFSTLKNRTYSSQQFSVEVNIIIAIREYSTPQAMRILKTMYKCIMYHLSNDECWEYMEVMSFHFEYSDPALLDRAVITFKAEEVEDFCYDYDPCPILTILGVRTSIEGTNEKVTKLKPKEFKHGK